MSTVTQLEQSEVLVYKYWVFRFCTSPCRRTQPSLTIRKPTELMEEERHCRIKAQEAMDHKARVEESKNTTVDDLTRGIINYTYLGFDFVKAKGNGLRCVESISASIFQY